jgi:hypothetical protein
MERPRERDAVQPTRGLPEANQFGCVLLLSWNPEDAGIADSLGAKLLEERVRAARRRHDLSASEGHPLPLKASKDLG